MIDTNRTRIMHIATDSRRRIAAAVIEDHDDDISIGLEPLDGQMVYETELPAELAGIESPAELMAILADATVSATGELQYRPIRPRDDDPRDLPQDE